jgi:hypothetical protein
MEVGALSRLITYQSNYGTGLLKDCRIILKKKTRLTRKLQGKGNNKNGQKCPFLFM